MNTPFSFDEDLETVVRRVSYPEAQVVGSRNNVAVGELSGATRVEFKIPPGESKEVSVP